MNRPFPAYSGDEEYEFVCYSHSDAESVYTELAWLNESGRNLWYDEGIRPGEEWTDELAAAIENSSHVIFFASENAVASKYCRDELYFAIEMDKPIIVVHLHPLELTGGLRLSLGKTQALLRYELETLIYRERLLSYLHKKDQAEKIVQTATSISIAVLPFVNMSSDPENEYFSDGITEEIIALLVRSNTVPVIARTSSFQFKDTQDDIVEIGRKLNVSHILEGSVRKIGTRVRINAQLADATTGANVWSDRYDSELEDIFDLQDEVATAIVGEVQPRLLNDPGMPDRTTAQKTTNAEAYDLYLKAESCKQQFNPEQLNQSIDYYAQCLELDPGFTDAWIGLAYAHIWRAHPFFALEYPYLAYRAISDAAQHALELEPRNPRAIFLEGYIAAADKHEWKRGFGLMQKAIDQNPHDSEPITIFGEMLVTTRQPGAGGYLERAYRLDPLSIAAIFLCGYLFRHGKQRDGIVIIEPLLVRDQKNYLVRFAIGFVHMMLMKFDDAERHFDYVRQFVSDDNPVMRVIDLWMARLKKNVSEVALIGQELLERSRSERIPFLYIPWHEESAAEIYQRLVDWNDMSLVGVLIQNKPPSVPDDVWDSLHEQMNMEEVLASTVRSMFRVRGEAEKKDLISSAIPIDQQTMEDLCGIYEGAYELVFSERDGQIWLQASIFGIESAVVKTLDNHYELLSESLWVEFEFNSDNEAVGCTLHQGETFRDFVKKQ